MADLRITELDFDGIKENLKVYLKGQEEFKDYDFEGSAMSVFLDVLAYNTFYNGYYSNITANEMFLQTAQLRDNVLLKAKELNYLPKSKTAPYANIKIEVTANDSSTDLVLPAYTPFETEFNGTVYKFTNTDEYVAFKTPTGTLYTFENVKIYQGSPKTDTYYNDSTIKKKFIILSDNVDISTLRVFVSPSASISEGIEYFSATNSVAVSSEDKAYWLSQNNDGRYYITFGNGIIGKTIENDSFVYLQYLNTQGSAGNTISEFDLVNDLSNIQASYSPIEDPPVISIQLQTESSYARGGADEEDIESIKFNAPKFAQTQNRAITVEDFKSILKSQYDNIRSISVWGGEDNDPPSYGTVFASIQPKDSLFLSTNTKKFLQDMMKSFSPPTTSLEILDTNYTYLVLNIAIKYDKTQTTNTESSIKAAVSSATKKYIEDNVSKYEEYFRYSKLVNAIDEADASISGNVTDVVMKQLIYPKLGESNSFTIKFNNTLEQPNEGYKNTITSSQFRFNSYNNCYIRSEDGKLNITFINESGEEIVVNETIGTYNKSTGTVDITSFMPTGASNVDGSIEIYAIPESYDIIPLRDQIITVLEADINVSVTDDSKLLLDRQES
jgi:hypothetical protein